MTERATDRRRTARNTSPINFRMPTVLRSRLRRFAEERNLGESEALRLAVSERLNQIDDEHELAAAERWQFEQAYATWREHLRTGRRDTVAPETIHQMFPDHLAKVPARRAPK